MNVRSLSIIAAAAMALLACGRESVPVKPELPQSVAPGWARKAYAESTPPEGLPPGPKPACWKAEYAAGGGSGMVWICGYAAESGAFDAAQRARAEADTVKFQEGRYLAIVKWSGGSKTDITALVRAVQKNLLVR